MRQRINVIVLILLLAVFGSLLVAGIAKIRAAHARYQDGTNIRMILLALHNHHDQLGRFPTGTRPNENLGPEKRLSWMAILWPYIEQVALYKIFNLDKAWDAPENCLGIKRSEPAYLSEKNPNKQLPDGPALSHYVGLAGVGLDAATLPANDSRAGFFGYDRKIISTDIKDGTSQTICLIDTASMNGPWAAGGPATMRSVLSSLQPYIGVNRQFGGVHEGVAFLGLADASVRSINGTVSPATLEAVATIAGGEVLSQDWMN